MEPSERAGDLGALIKGWLAKDAVSAKGQQTNRYFALVPSCLLYFDSDSSSAFKPKGAWALSECNGNGRSHPMEAYCAFAAPLSLKWEPSPKQQLTP